MCQDLGIEEIKIGTCLYPQRGEKIVRKHANVIVAEKQICVKSNRRLR